MFLTQATTLLMALTYTLLPSVSFIAGWNLITNNSLTLFQAAGIWLIAASVWGFASLLIVMIRAGHWTRPDMEKPE